MDSRLKEINDIYVKIEDYFFPAPGYFDVTKVDKEEYIRKQQEYKSLYLLANSKFIEIADQLTHDDLIEGYEKGTRLLQANISGEMCSHFNKKYIPVMLSAIQNDHGHTAHLFLRALTLDAKELPEGFISVILGSLRSQYLATQSAALSASLDLRIIEALPIVQEMAKNPISEIREMAENFLSTWSKRGT